MSFQVKLSSEQSFSPAAAASGDFKDETDPGETFSYLTNDVYRKWIIEHVRCSEVISKMPFMRGIAGHIYHMDSVGKSKEAAEMFLDKLKESDEHGKYRYLLRGLEDAGYTHLVNAINKGTVNEHHEEHKKILDIFMDPLLQKIDAPLMANNLYMKKVISRNDLDLIMKTSSSKSDQWAAFQLLDAIPRKNENWYTIFWETLFEQGHKRLCKEVDPKLYAQKQSSENVPTSLDQIAQRNNRKEKEEENLLSVENLSPPYGGTTTESFISLLSCSADSSVASTENDQESKIDHLQATVNSLESKIDDLQASVNTLVSMLSQLVKQSSLSAQDKCST